MFKKALILSALAASLLSAGSLVTPASAAMRLHVPHPRPIGHHALPYRHGHISVANLPGHRPAYRHHRRHHVAHAKKPHHVATHHEKPADDKAAPKG